jgi:HAD superfamily hydrolase (TIGR01509 family)
LKTVIFDFFGVICSEIAPFVLPKYMSAADAVRYKATIVQDADMGTITQAEMFARLSEIAHVPAKQLEDEFWSYVKIDPATVALIERLRSRTKVALLTNAIVPFVRQIMARNDLARLFDAVAVSSEEHMTKPDPAYYRLLLSRMGIGPEDAVFVDDNPVNLAGAKNAGLEGLLFTSAAQTERELKDRFAIG